MSGAMLTGVLAMGLVAAMDRAGPAVRRAMAWTGPGAASASLVLMVLQSIGSS